MNIRLIALSAAASAVLTAATPMVSTSMSTDNGGTKSAIDAYSDGGGVVIINQAGDTKFDNSAMNSLVFKYGQKAEDSGTTLKNQVSVLSADTTAAEKAISVKFDLAKVVINPPVNGTSCDDGNPQTLTDIWSNGLCGGVNVESQLCNDNVAQTINDIYHNGVCAGTNVEGVACNDNVAQTINDVYHNGVCAGTNVEGQACNDTVAKTYGDKYSNGVCAGVVTTSCKQIKNLVPSAIDGVYSINPDSNGINNTFDVYCDMTTDGGGWTLVWSNLINRAGNLQENMTFAVATTTRPIFNGTLSSTKESFEVYTGLNEWNKIGGNTQMDIMYQWSASGIGINQAFKAKLNPFVANGYQLNMSGYSQLVGATQSGLYYYHNGFNFSTYNYDQDAHSVSCAAYYSNTPWWYGSCWSGSINGGGTSAGSGYPNGAYWISSEQQMGVASTGIGAGSGWIFIR